MPNRLIAKSRNFITPLILTSITILVYLPTLQYPFQFDDLPNILNYTKLKLTTFSELYLSSSRWVCIWLNSLIYQYFNSSPFVCRLINLAFHTSAGLILFWLLTHWWSHSKNSLIKRNWNWMATIVTGTFLLHPVQSQTTCYIIQGQLEGLASLLILICLALYTQYCKEPVGRHGNLITKLPLVLLLLIMLTLASSTKEIAIITPFLILLCDWFWIAQGNWIELKSRFKLHLTLFFTTSVIYLYYLKSQFFINMLLGKASVQSSVGNLLSPTGDLFISQTEFIRSQFKVLLHYLYIAIWPFDICIEYDWQLTRYWSDFDCLVPGLIWVLISIGLIILWRKNNIHPIVFGILWFLICTIPRSLAPSGELLVDYKVYLANIGWLMTLSYLLIYFLDKYLKSRVAQIAILILIITGCATTTWYRKLVWSSQLTFWEDVIKKAPHKARGFNNYGMALIEQNELDKSIFYFKKALNLNHFNGHRETFFWDPYINLANVYAMQNQIDLAVDLIRKGLAINPEVANLHNNLGALLEFQGKKDEAIIHLHKAIQLKSNSGQAMCTLGKIYLASNQPELAWQWLKRACQSTHMDRVAATLQIFAEASIKTKHWTDAVWALEKLLLIQPNHMESWLNLGSVYYFNGANERAKICYNKASQLNPNDPRIKQMLVKMDYQ